MDAYSKEEEDTLDRRAGDVRIAYDRPLNRETFTGGVLNDVRMAQKMHADRQGNECSTLSEMNGQFERVTEILPEESSSWGNILRLYLRLEVR